MGVLVALVVLGGIVIAVIAVVRRVLEKRDAGPDSGGDVIAYLILALAVIVAGFALAELGQAAFPGDTFVANTDRLVASSLAALVVAGPVAGFLWRRQAKRRLVYPASAGWTVYLALIEAVFTTAFVVAAISILNWLLAEGNQPSLTDVLVFAGVLVFHEVAARNTPPTSDASDLPRVVGSAIGLVTLAIGVGGTLFWLFDRIYGSFEPTVGDPSQIGTWVAFLVVGAPIWWYRWLRPWPTEPGVPRDAWMFLSSVFGLFTALGSAVWFGVQVLLFIIGEAPSAGRHFDTLPAQLALGIVGVAVWAHHRSKMGSERTNPVRAYEYAMAAGGLLASIGSATGLTALALGPESLIGNDRESIIPVAFVLLTALSVWGWFWRKASLAPREEEAGTGPRRFYLVGLAIITGLISAGALIGTLVVLFQRMLDVSEGETLVVQASLFLYAGLATWHLLRTNSEDRDLVVSEEVITPFAVTIVCSHPGSIASVFPKEARLRVVYRGDEAGIIDEEMATAIVSEVGQSSSLVWVDGDGYRVAPAR